MNYAQSKKTYTTGFLIAAVAGMLFLSLPAVNVSADDDSKDDSRKIEKPLNAKREIHIAQDGTILVRGGTVSAISGNDITAKTVIGNTEISWKIQTDSATKFLGKNGGTSTLAAITTGDSVSFSGTFLNSSFVVDAHVVKNWNEEGTIATAFSGEIKSINKDNESFVITTTKYGDVTVDADDASFVAKDNVVIDIDDLTVGETAYITGTYTNDTKTIVAAKVAIGDFKVNGKGDGRWPFKNFFKGLGPKWNK